jgi:hypothetical protein
MEAIPIQANGISSEASGGVRQQHKGFKPPTPGLPGQLTAEMAEAAAVKYKKDQKKIQKACAALEPQNDDKKTCGCCNGGCVIM